MAKKVRNLALINFPFGLAGSASVNWAYLLRPSSVRRASINDGILQTEFRLIHQFDCAKKHLGMNEESGSD
jgi:hypothetical protein